MSPDSFEDRIRAFAQEVSRSAERMSQADMDEIADAIGVDPTRAREWVQSAGSWLRAQAEGLGDEVTFPSAPRNRAPAESQPTPAENRQTSAEDPLSNAGPHPLDLPTEEQGLALAAIDSGRWTVEPGSNALAGHGDGPGPKDALGLVRELYVRDWIAADGKITVVGRHALRRWLEGSDSR